MLQTYLFQALLIFYRYSNPLHLLLLSGNLQGQKKVLETGVRGGLVRPGQHGHHGGLLHAQRHQGRRGKEERG